VCEGVKKLRRVGVDDYLRFFAVAKFFMLNIFTTSPLLVKYDTFVEEILVPPR